MHCWTVSQNSQLRRYQSIVTCLASRPIVCCFTVNQVTYILAGPLSLLQDPQTPYETHDRSYTCSSSYWIQLCSLRLVRSLSIVCCSRFSTSTSLPRLNPTVSFTCCKMLAHDLCSALQNAFRARHKYAAFPHSNQSLGILSILLQHGFLLHITRGTSAVPSPEAFISAPEADRRIWAALKYRDDRPVLNACAAVSVPHRRAVLRPQEVVQLAAGRGVRHVPPLGMGEVAVIKTKDRAHEWIEAREAVRLGLGGEIMCRAN